MECQCRALFGIEGLHGSTLQSAVSKRFPVGECELCSVSAYSPGRVDPAEVITKLIVDPIHLDEGQLSPVAFMDAYSIDLSVFREQLATDAEIQIAINQIKATGLKKSAPQLRSVVGVAQTTVAKLRNAIFSDSRDRMFFVYDTGEKDKPAHASVFTPERVKSSKSDQRAARKILHAAFSETIIDANDYRMLNY